jgi:glucose/arabinose dehydrogenase
VQPEHGALGGDELNILTKGGNFGWPVACRTREYANGNAVCASPTGPGMTEPAVVWQVATAPSGLMIYSGDKFPLWQGDIFVGGLAGQLISRLEMSEDFRSVVREEELLYDMGRIRDIREGPDGYIYAAIEDRQGAPTAIVRMEPL